jgi:predicted DNA-binding WGR domain protein
MKTEIHRFYRIEVCDNGLPIRWETIDWACTKQDALKKLKDRLAWCSKHHRVIKCREEIVFEN